MRIFWTVVAASFLVFFFSWLAVFKSGINPLSIQSEDTLPAMFIPLAVIKDKTLYLDSYYEMMRARYPHPDDEAFEKGLTPFYLREVRGSYVSAFPIMAGLLAIPVYALPVVFGMPATFENVTLLSHISSALIVSLAGGFMYVLLKSFFVDSRKAIILTVVYLFASINYAVISQALWQHGAVQLFEILALLFLFKAFSKKSLCYLFLSSLMLSLGILSRPTGVLLVPFLFLLVVEYFGVSRGLVRAVFVYIAGFVPAVLFFLWYNGSYYLSIYNQGYSRQIFVNWLGRFPEGFMGLWLSPSKGILIYSPVLIFSLIGFYLAVRNGMWRRNFKYVVFGCIVLLHTLFMGSWKHWFGGWSFGYRMAADVLPFLVLLAAPYLKSDLYSKTRRLFNALLIFSIAFQIFGLVFFDGIWHAAYDTGYKDTSWLWSLKDSEFVFNVRRILVKFGIVERACEKCSPLSV
ncbi:glycosyltransferase family 39 protein [candidate division WWE3 bacterium]|nr:glycosyltransferase family 39 protein [candidate division WWE3 bacterium]